MSDVTSDIFNILDLFGKDAKSVSNNELRKEYKK